MKLDFTIDASRVATFIERIGWPVPGAPLLRAIRDFVPWQGRIQLNLAVHPGFAPPLEVEIFAGSTDFQEEERPPFLDRLIAAGLASSAKASVLRGVSAQPLIDDTAGRPFARSWYAKVRFDESGACDAKAYLGLMPRRSRANSFR